MDSSDPRDDTGTAVAGGPAAPDETAVPLGAAGHGVAGAGRREGGRHDVLAAADAITAAAHALLKATERAWALPDPDLLDAADAVCRASAVMESARLAMIRLIDDRPGIIPRTAAPAAAFLTHRLHLDPRAAAADVRAAHALTGPDATLPTVGAALATGAITRAHADVAVRTVTRMPARLFTTPVPDDPDPDTTALDERAPAADVHPQRTGLQVADAWLAEQARTFPVASTQRLADALVAVLDPDHTARYDEDAHLRRTLVLAREHSTGMGLLRAALTPTDTALLDTYLSHTARPTPAVPAQAQDEHDDGGALVDVLVRDTRTTGMRRYDALMTLVRAGLAGRPLTHAGLADDPGSATDPASAAYGTDPADPAGAPYETNPAGAAGDIHTDAAGQLAAGHAGAHAAPDPLHVPSPPVHLLVTATLEQVATAGRAAQEAATRATGITDVAGVAGVAESADTTAHAPAFGTAAGLATLHRHGPIHPALLGYLACTPTVQRLLLSPGGTPLDLGRTHRLATPAQRRALAARDGGCTTPGCTVPHEGTDAHHQTPWSLGGATDLDNLISLCPRHHQELHAGLWQTRIHDGHVQMRPPAWIDPYRRWTRNTFHAAHRHTHQLAQQLRLALDDGDGRARPPPPP